MAGPGWLADALAVVMAVTACYCGVRLAIVVLRRRPSHRDADIVGVAMAVLMAGMLAGAVDAQNGLLAVSFGVAAVWFLWRGLYAYVLHGARTPAIGLHARHGVLSAAMVAMVAGAGWPATAQPATAMTGMAGMSSAAAPGPSLLLVALLAGLLAVAAWDIARLVPGRPAADGPVLLAPRLVVCCELAMAGAMGYMLLVMR